MTTQAEYDAAAHLFDTLLRLPDDWPVRGHTFVANMVVFTVNGQTFHAAVTLAP